MSQQSIVEDNLIATADGMVVRIFDAEHFFNAKPPDCQHILTARPIPDNLNVDVENSMCSTCGGQEENWFCLVCHKLFCGRFAQGHMVAHYSDTGHCVSISMTDLSVWCYACDTYLDYDFFPLLQAFFAKLHALKFGEQPQDAYKLHDRLPESEGPGSLDTLLTGHKFQVHCTHLSNIVKKLPTKSQGWLDSPCAMCRNNVENWICLECLQVYCGRFVEKHMLEHHKQSGHSVCLSLVDLSIWCYECVQYLDHSMSVPLHNIYDFFHKLKFQTPAPALPDLGGLDDSELFAWHEPGNGSSFEPTGAQETDGVIGYGTTPHPAGHVELEYPSIRNQDGSRASKARRLE